MGTQNSSSSSSSSGIKVSIPASHKPAPHIPTQEELIALAHPTSTYDPDYDVLVIVCLLNSSLHDVIDLMKLRMWLLGIPVINPIIEGTGSPDFPPEYLITLHKYTAIKHPHRTNWMFRRALHLLSCGCSYEIRTGVLTWISNYVEKYNDNGLTPP
jgi:hypothetical protein